MKQEIKRDSINLTEDIINILLGGYSDIVLSETETKKCIKTLDFSNLEQKGIFKGTAYLNKIIKQKYNLIIWFNNDFKNDSYTSKLLFKEVFFWENLKQFAFIKLQERIKFNKLNNQNELNKSLWNDWKFRQLPFYKIKCFNKKINRQGFIKSIPAQKSINLNDCLREDISVFNNFNNWKQNGGLVKK